MVCVPEWKWRGPSMHQTISRTMYECAEELIKKRVLLM